MALTGVGWGAMPQQHPLPWWSQMWAQSLATAGRGHAGPGLPSAHLVDCLPAAHSRQVPEPRGTCLHMPTQEGRSAGPFLPPLAHPSPDRHSPSHRLLLCTHRGLSTPDTAAMTSLPLPRGQLTGVNLLSGASQIWSRAGERGIPYRERVHGGTQGLSSRVVPRV